jgi:ribosomal-protein-alanine N-acetyltransferase
MLAPKHSSSPFGVVPLAADAHDEVMRLFEHRTPRHVHIDWREMADWLPHPGLRCYVGGQNGRVQSVLGATIHDSPDGQDAAWLRFALPGSAFRPGPTLDPLWEALRADLSASGVGIVALLVINRWVEEIATRWGFEETNAVITLVRRRGPIPLPPVPPVTLRELGKDTSELDTVARIDAEAFDSIWRYDRDTLAAAQEHAATFTCLERNGEMLGYQLSTAHGESGHLARLAVLPEAQGQGYGSALVGGMLRTFEQRGISVITVNTQEDNLRSQQLYDRLGFIPTGHRAPVWTLAL